MPKEFQSKVNEIIAGNVELFLIGKIKILADSSPEHHKEIITTFISNKGLDKIIEGIQGSILPRYMKILAVSFPGHHKEIITAFISKKGLDKIIADTQGVFLYPDIKALAETFPEHHEEIITAFISKKGLDKIIADTQEIRLTIDTNALANTFPEFGDLFSLPASQMKEAIINKLKSKSELRVNTMMVSKLTRNGFFGALPFELVKHIAVLTNESTTLTESEKTKIVDAHFDMSPYKMPTLGS